MVCGYLKNRLFLINVLFFIYKEELDKKAGSQVEINEIPNNELDILNKMEHANR